MKEKLNPLVEEYRKSTVKKNSFRVLNTFYITNFCETRKINSNEMRVLLFHLNFRKIRKWALGYMP